MVWQAALSTLGLVHLSDAILTLLLLSLRMRASNMLA